MSKDSTLTLRIKMVGPEEVKRAILSVGQTAVQVSKTTKEASDQSRKAADQARETWQKAAAAAKGASKEEGAAKREAAAEAKAAYMQMEQAARQASRAMSQSAKDSLSVLTQTSRAIIQSDKDIAASGVAAAKARSQADKDAANVAKQTARDSATAQKQAALANQSPLQRRLAAINSGAATDKYENIQNALSATGGIGVGLTGAAAAGGAILGKGLMNEDEMRRARRAMTFSLGSEDKADRRIAELKGVDRSSSFDLRSLEQSYTSLLGRGFEEQEAMDLLKGTGDIIARTQGDSGNLMAAFQQFSQIKGKGKVGMQDINALSEGGGIPVVKILTEQLGADRMKSVMSGDEPLSADEFFGAFMKGVQKYKGGMQEANDSLTGDLSNLSSALYQASDATNGLLTPVRDVVQAVTTAVDAFNSLPGPLKTIGSYGVAAGIVLVGIGGVTLTFLSAVGRAILAFKTLEAGLNSLGNNAVANAAKTGTAGAATGAAGTAGAGATVAGGAATGAAAGAGTTAATGISLAGLAAAAASAPVWLAGGALGILGYEGLRAASNATGVGMTDMPSTAQIVGTYTGLTDSPTEQARKQHEEEQKAALASASTSMPSRMADAAASSPVSQMGGGNAPILTGDLPQFTNLADPDSFTGQIRALEDAKDGADKDKKEEIGHQIRTLRRQQQDSRKAMSRNSKAQRLAEREAKAAAKMETGDELAEARASNDLTAADRIDDLEKELAEAKADNDDQRVGQLTYEIALEKAKKVYQDKMAAAARQKSASHRKALERVAGLELKAADRRAATAGNRAAAVMQRSDERGSEKNPALSGAQINALFRASGGGTSSALRGFSPLNPSGQMGDPTGRFAQSGSWNGQAIDVPQGYSPVHIGALDPSRVGGGMTRGIPGVGDFGRTPSSGGGRATSRETGRDQIRLPNGDYKTTLTVEVTTPRDEFTGADVD